MSKYRTNQTIDNINQTSCQPIICHNFQSQAECLAYNVPQYRGICAWNDNKQVYTGNGIYLTGNDTTPYCYNNCTQGLEIVITIDTSSSVSIADREHQVQVVISIVTDFWELIDTHTQARSTNTSDLLKFALITYGRNVKLHFGLDNVE